MQEYLSRPRYFAVLHALTVGSEVGLGAFLPTWILKSDIFLLNFLQK